VSVCFTLTQPFHTIDLSSKSWCGPRRSKTESGTTYGDEWVINGRKSWISNGPYADFAMVFARTSGQPGRIDGISCFLVDADTPGFEVGDIHRPMGHAWVAPSELELDDCRVGEDALLGEEGRVLPSDGLDR